MTAWGRLKKRFGRGGKARLAAAAMAFAALTLGLAACGGDDNGEDDGGGGSNGVEVEGRGTYTLIEATTAETGDELATALGAEQGVGGQYQDPAVGTYVIATVELNSSDEDSSDEDSPIVLVDGDGDTHEVGLGQIGVGEDDDEDSLTLTHVFDVPTEAIPGSVLRFGEADTAATMELGL